MPVSSLPPEVLGKIFVSSLPVRDSNRLYVQNAPVVLCRVSPGWRAIAISEPRLWDTIIFPPSDRRQYFNFIRSGEAERWFDRTGPVWPLNFGDEPSDEPPGSLITIYLHIISKYARRFKHLSLVMTKIMHLESFRRGFPQDIFDRLESVSLCCSSKLTGEVLHCFPRLVTPFKTASRLKHISFTLLKEDPTKFVLPWAQVTTVDVASWKRPLDLEAWRSLMETCPNLQHGTFVFPWCPMASSRPASVHASLKSLTLVLPSQWAEVLDQEPYRPRVHNYDLEVLFSAVTFSRLQRIRFDFYFYRKPLINIPFACKALGSSLKTVILVWQDPFRVRHPGTEAFELFSKIMDEPGAFSALRRIVFTCNPQKIDSLLPVLRSHPRLHLTIAASPDRLWEWADAIGEDEQSDFIKSRVDLLSANDYHLLDEDSYFDAA